MVYIEKYFDKIKIKNLIILIILIMCIVAGVSEIGVMKQVSENFYQLISNCIVLLWIIFSTKTNYATLHETFCDAKDKINIKEIVILSLINKIISISSILLPLFIIFKIYPQSMDELLQMESSSLNIIECVVSFLSIVICAPIVEEIIFRGILLRRIANKYSVLTGLILTSILFGISHPSFGIIGAIVSGLIFGLLYLKYNNILIPMLAHIINNAISEFIGIAGLFIKDNKEVFSVMTINIGIVVSLVVLITACYLLWNFINKNLKLHIKKHC